MEIKDGIIPGAELGFLNLYEITTVDTRFYSGQKHQGDRLELRFWARELEDYLPVVVFDEVVFFYEYNYLDDLICGTWQEKADDMWCGFYLIRNSTLIETLLADRQREGQAADYYHYFIKTEDDHIHVVTSEKVAPMQILFHDQIKGVCDVNLSYSNYFREGSRLVWLKSTLDFSENENSPKFSTLDIGISNLFIHDDALKCLHFTNVYLFFDGRDNKEVFHESGGIKKWGLFRIQDSACIDKNFSDKSEVPELFHYVLIICSRVYCHEFNIITSSEPELLHNNF